jgi:hypothetical protein
MADHAVQTVAYATLNVEQHPPTALYVAPMSTFLCSGENVILKELHSLLPQQNITTKIGRIVNSTDAGDAVAGPMVQIQWYVLLTDLDTLPKAPELRAPPTRTYIKFPINEVVLTNFVSSVPVTAILSAAFIVSPDSVSDASFSKSIGMDNAYTIRFRLKQSTRLVEIEKLVTWMTFPENVGECHTRRLWCLLERIGSTITDELSKTSLSQSLKSSKTLDIGHADWNYLEKRLEPIGILKRPGVSSVRVNRASASREVVKHFTTKKVIRIDTKAKMTIFKSVFGATVTIGLKQKPPKTPNLRKRDGMYSFNIRRMRTSDRVNAILLPDNQAQAYHPNTTSRGLDLLYDPRRSKLTLKIRYEELDANNPLVLQELGIGSNGGAADLLLQQVEEGMVEVDDLFEVENVLYSVLRFEGNLVVCLILESDDADYEAGTHITFSMADASRNIREYNS